MDVKEPLSISCLASYFNCRKQSYFIIYVLACRTHMSKSFNILYLNVCNTVQDPDWNLCQTATNYCDRTGACLRCNQYNKTVSKKWEMLYCIIEKDSV